MVQTESDAPDHSRHMKDTQLELLRESRPWSYRCGPAGFTASASHKAVPDTHNTSKPQHSLSASELEEYLGSVLQSAGRPVVPQSVSQAHHSPPDTAAEISPDISVHVPTQVLVDEAGVSNQAVADVVSVVKPPKMVKGMLKWVPSDALMV